MSDYTVISENTFDGTYVDGFVFPEDDVEANQSFCSCCDPLRYKSIEFNAGRVSVRLSIYRGELRLQRGRFSPVQHLLNFNFCPECGRDLRTEVVNDE